MLVNMPMINVKVKDSFFGKMERVIMGPGKMGYNMGMGYLHQKMEIWWKDIGKMAKELQIMNKY